MAKQIKFKYDGEDITLEYTKATVKWMEQNGIVAKDIDEKTNTILPALFAGAFRANHRRMSRAKIDEIWDTIPNKDDFLAKLAEMYYEPIEQLMKEPETKKTEWTASW